MARGRQWPGLCCPRIPVRGLSPCRRPPATWEHPVGSQVSAGGFVGHGSAVRGSQQRALWCPRAHGCMLAAAWRRCFSCQCLRSVAHGSRLACLQRPWCREVLGRCQARHGVQWATWWGSLRSLALVGSNHDVQGPPSPSHRTLPGQPPRLGRCCIAHYLQCRCSGTALPFCIKSALHPCISQLHISI